MVSILSLLEIYIFPGIVGNTAYDLIKSSWLATTNKKWEDLYIDAFQAAFDEQHTYLLKYAKEGDVYLDISRIKSALDSDLQISLDLAAVSELTDNQFAQKLAKLLHKREAIVIGGHNLSEADYSSLMYRFVQLSINLFKENVVSNERAFREAVLKEAKNNQELMRALEILMNSKVNLLFDDLQGIKDSLNKIRELLTIDRPKEVIENEIEISINSSKFILCDEYSHEILADNYFIAQEFNNNKSDLRESIDNAMKQLGFASVRADDSYWGGPILCKISSLILGTPFGVYQLSESQNRNVHLELGIAMGLGKPFVLVKDKTAEVADLIRGIEYYEIDSYLETRYSLGNHLQKYITNIGTFRTKITKNLFPQNSAIIAHGHLEHVDIGVTIAKQLVKFGYEPIILGDFDEKLAKYLKLEHITPLFAQTKEEVVSAIQASRFGIYRTSKAATADTFVKLGIAIGSSKPFFLVANQRDQIPSDLEGLSLLKFHGFTDLESKLEMQLQPWLERIGLIVK